MSESQLGTLGSDTNIAFIHSIDELLEYVSSKDLHFKVPDWNTRKSILLRANADNWIVVHSLFSDLLCDDEDLRTLITDYLPIVEGVPWDNIKSVDIMHVNKKELLELIGKLATGIRKHIPDADNHPLIVLCEYIQKRLDDFLCDNHLVKLFNTVMFRATCLIFVNKIVETEEKKLDK